jgi:hypothetical protein
MRKKKFNHQPGKDYCKQIGLPYWDTEFADRMDLMARELEFNQKEWDRAVREYAWKVKIMWNPANYSIWQRIKFVFYFLNPLHKKDQ